MQQETDPNDSVERKQETVMKVIKNDYKSQQPTPLDDDCISLLLIMQITALIINRSHLGTSTTVSKFHFRNNNHVLCI